MVDHSYHGLLNRRSFLKATGAGALASLTMSGRGTASVTDDYSTVIDVAEEGAATDGSEPITPLLNDLQQDDTLYVFPEGEYYMDEQFRFTGFENVGFVGNDATIVPADYDNFDDKGHGVYRLFRLGTYVSPGKHLRFTGFDVDQTAPETGVRVIDAVVDDELVVRDIHIDGQADMGCAGTARFAVSDPDGTGIVERFEAPDGAAWGQNTPRGDEIHRGGTGILSNTYNRGTLLFKDCVLNAFPNTGLYAAWGPGQIRVEGGRYANSNVAQIRLGGTDSYVRWATIAVDDTRPHDETQRGIRLENGRNLRVLDSELSITSPGPNNHAITVGDRAESAWIEDVYIDIFGDEPNSGIVVADGAGETTIYKTDLDMGVPSGYGIWLQEAADAPTVNCETVDITGDAGDDGARSAIFNARDNAEFREITVDQTGAPYRNALQNWADDVLIYDCGLTSSNYAIKDYGSGTWIEATYANATRGVEGLLLGVGSDGALVKENTLVDGIEPRGGDYRAWDNTY